jgi:hypothetical protein
MSDLTNFIKEATSFRIKSEEGDREISFSIDGDIEDSTGEFEKWIDISTDDTKSIYLKGRKAMVVLRWDLAKRFTGNSHQGSGVELYLNRNEEGLFETHFVETRNWEALTVESPKPEVVNTGEELVTVGLLSSQDNTLEGTILFKRSSLGEIESVDYVFDHSDSIEIVIISDIPHEAAAILEKGRDFQDAEVVAYKTGDTRISSFSMTREFFEVNRNRFKKKTKSLNLNAALKEVCNERKTKTLVLSPERIED